MFDKLRKKSSDDTAPPAGTDINAPQDTGADQEQPQGKPSLLQRLKDGKKGPQPISDADVLAYTGKSKAEIQEWAKDRPDTGANQVAGKLTAGNAGGLGGMMTSQGVGGWGPNAEGEAKFPPQQQAAAKEAVDDESV